MTNGLRVVFMVALILMVQSLAWGQGSPLVRSLLQREQDLRAERPWLGIKPGSSIVRPVEGAGKGYGNILINAPTITSSGSQDNLRPNTPNIYIMPTARGEYMKSRPLTMQRQLLVPDAGMIMQRLGSFGCSDWDSCSF